MKTLIRFDFPVQLFIALVSLIACLFHPSVGFIGIYFVLGGWQLLVAILHALFSSKPSGMRKSYHIALLFVVLLALSFYLLQHEALWYMGYGMLVVGPIMAIWNMAIAQNDRQNLQKEHTVWDAV